jgi:hypothetical protein
LNDSERNIQIKENILSNECYILERDKDLWKKELQSSTNKLSNITSRYIKKTTKKNINKIITSKVDNLEKRYNPYKKVIILKIDELKRKITVKNIDKIFSDILSEYKCFLDIKDIEIFYNELSASVGNDLEVSDFNRQEIKEIYSKSFNVEEAKKTISKIINSEIQVSESSKTYEKELNEFINENKLTKYNIELPKLNKMTKERIYIFKTLSLYIEKLEIKDKRKHYLFGLLNTKNQNKALLEIINHYTFNLITLAIIETGDTEKKLSFKKTCKYAGIHHTFDLHKTLNVTWSEDVNDNINILNDIDDNVKSITEDANKLDAQHLKLMSGIEERLTKNVHSSNPLNEHNWFKRGLHKSIFYEYKTMFFDSKYEEIITEWNENIVDKEAAKALLEDVPDLKDIYYRARKKKREIIFYAGETNSGKTYSAFNDLIKHKTGIYLAPLRLLALEGQEEISKRGYPCSYLTGEESDIQEGANFICSTIEMLSIKEEYDCAIIDEIQMIADENRGTGWLEALIGVNANRVILTGTKAALPIVQKLCNYTQDNLTVVELEKKTKLILDTREITTMAVPENTAIIAFSKKEIHRIKELIEEPTAIIYGSLSPEVRRKEAEKFRSGEAKILISTDAIGMGLNLPIENIYFSGIEKYNGIEFGKIKEEEVLQISGRAGRYKLFDEGKVGFIDTGNSLVTRKTSISYIKKVIDQKISKDVEVARLSITRNMFGILSDLLDSEDLKRIARFFFKFMQKKINQDFITVTIPTDFYDRLDLVDEVIQKIELMKDVDVVSFEDKLNLLFLPLDASKKSTEGKSVVYAFLSAKYLSKDHKIKLFGQRQIDLLPISLLGIEKLERNVHICDLLHNLKLKYPEYNLSDSDHEHRKVIYQDAMSKIINHDEFSANCRVCETPIEIGVHNLCEKCFKSNKKR